MAATRFLIPPGPLVGQVLAVAVTCRPVVLVILSKSALTDFESTQMDC